VIYTIGSKITEVTPSRGFAMEFATATVVLVGSKMGLPVSTTHIIIGAVIGVGFARGMAALNTQIVGQIVSSWIITVPVAALLAGVGGVLLVWYNGLITPNSVGTGWLINVLVIAVLGGMKHPIGAFIGAIVFVLLQTFAIDLIDRERFNLVIGGVFLAIVLFSPDGLLGLWAKLRARFGPNQVISSTSLNAPRRQA
jgi:branched-chain amino acid transport system permease protein